MSGKKEGMNEFMCGCLLGENEWDGMEWLVDTKVKKLALGSVLLRGWIGTNMRIENLRISAMCPYFLGFIDYFVCVLRPRTCFVYIHTYVTAWTFLLSPL